MNQYQHENRAKIKKEAKIQHAVLFNESETSQSFIKNEIKKAVSLFAFSHMCAFVLRHILNEIFLMK
jgi:hypothetical protein